MTTPLLIFDLDGTLVDSKRDLTASVNHVRHSFNLTSLTEEEIAGFIGNGAHAMIRSVLGSAAPESDVISGLQIFLSYYREHMLDNSALYPGVAETLDRLRDCTMAVLTNKPIRFSSLMLEGLGVRGHFASVYGGNSFDRKKPDPVGVFQILADTNASRDNTWMIGDSAVDVLTGRNAGVTTCGVTYGYAAHTFNDNPPDHVIDHFPDLEILVSKTIFDRNLSRQ